MLSWSSPPFQATHRWINRFLDNPEKYKSHWTEVDLILWDDCIIGCHPSDFSHTEEPLQLSHIEKMHPRYRRPEESSLEKNLQWDRNKVFLFWEILGFVKDRWGKIYFDLKISDHDRSEWFIERLLDEIELFLLDHHNTKEEVLTWFEYNVIFSWFDVLLLLRLRERFEEKYQKTLTLHATWTTNIMWSNQIDVFARRIEAIIEWIDNPKERSWFKVGIDFCIKNKIDSINVPTNIFLDFWDTQQTIEFIEYARGRNILIIVFVQSQEEMLQLKDLWIESFEHI